MREKTEVLKARIEAEERTKQERENKDIREEQLRIKAAEDRETVLKAIAAAGTTIGNGISDFLGDTEKVAVTVGLVTAVAIGVYGARSGAAVVGQYASARLAKPPLIRETNRKRLMSPVKAIKSMFQRPGMYTETPARHSGGATPSDLIPVVVFRRGHGWHYPGTQPSNKA